VAYDVSFSHAACEHSHTRYISVGHTTSLHILHYNSMLYFFPMEQEPLVIEASRSHSDTPHSVGLLWTSDHSDADTST